MDLTQTKLTKQEWQTTEIPVSEQEKHVLSLIMQGFDNPDIRINLNQSLFTFMKVGCEERDALENPLYEQFFQPIMDACPIPDNKYVENTDKKGPKGSKGQKGKPKKADLIRIANLAQNIALNRGLIFEYTLLDLVVQIRDSLKAKTDAYAQALYTLLQIQKATIPHINKYVHTFVETWIQVAQKKLHLMDIVTNAEEYIEKNRYLGKYADWTLFSHQKDLFRLFKKPSLAPTLVLYIAPTGTGKTLSPLGLAQNGKAVIFVCSARHVGLGLARAAVSVQKKVAFAYGCASSEDIRLHNYAAVDYLVNKRSGAIAKVDNSNGSKVEIMICDVHSYLVAMRYMMEFHTVDSLILFWDEPTITMDYPDHPLHTTIHNNWNQNQIGHIVLSCATLPLEHELTTTLDDFKLRFSTPERAAIIKPIVSFDFKKSISVLQNNGKCVLPHLLFSDFKELLDSVEHVRTNPTLLRYMDLFEVTRFIRTMALPADVSAYFEGDIRRVTMTSLKMYYLHLLEQLEEDAWPNLYTFFTQSLQPKFQTVAPDSSVKKSFSMTDIVPLNMDYGNMDSGKPILRMQSLQNVPLKEDKKKEDDPFAGIRLTTGDAWTLTDGPTIYIAENVENIGLFYIQQTALPKFETDEIQRKINQNSVFQKRVDQLEKEIEDKKGKDATKDKKAEKDTFSREVKELEGQLSRVKQQIEPVRLRPDYVPNSEDHLLRFLKEKNKEKEQGKPFAPNIEDADVVKIMALDVEGYKKVLLLLGIGMFTLKSPTPYLELMKELAIEQKLYMILASSDYIYGTNYAFCHGIVSKDLTGMTQQKTIQAMGRIGRNAVQQDYTVRFRNNDIVKALYLPPKGNNLEATNMCRLFS